MSNENDNLATTIITLLIILILTGSVMYVSTAPTCKDEEQIVDGVKVTKEVCR